MLSGEQVAGLIVALFWAILVSFLAFVLIRLARLLAETTKLVSEIGDQTRSLLEDMTETVEQAGEQLDRVDAIIKGMAGVGTVVTSVVSGPLVKGAAFAYGVRKVLGQQRQSERSQRVVRSASVTDRPRAVEQGRPNRGRRA